MRQWESITIVSMSETENTPNPSELKAAIIGVIETVLNEYLGMDETAHSRLGSMASKVIAIEIVGWDITLYLLPDAHGIQVMSEYMGDADTTIRGKPFALFNMSRSETSAATLREQDITIDGDLEQGQQFNLFFKQLDIDWEEKLAQTLAKFGSESNADLIAHQFGRVIKGFQQWQPQAQQTLEENIAEYFQQESKMLPMVEEIEPFNHAVDMLRNDVDRLEARIQRLISKNSAESKAD